MSYNLREATWSETSQYQSYLSKKYLHDSLKEKLIQHGQPMNLSFDKIEVECSSEYDDEGSYYYSLSSIEGEIATGVTFSLSYDKLEIDNEEVKDGNIESFFYGLFAPEEGSVCFSSEDLETPPILYVKEEVV